MNEAGVPFTRKDEVSLLASPVGPCGPAAVVGMATVGDSALTPASVTAYSVLTLVLWFAIENEPSALNEVPQGFLRLGSVSIARPGMSETKLVWAYAPCGPSDGALGTVRSSNRSSRGTIRLSQMRRAPRRVRAPLAAFRFMACSHVLRRKVMTVA